MSRFAIGVDVGGTFTDLMLIDGERGAYAIAKVPTTVEDQSVGFLVGLQTLGAAPADIATITHGTTVGTNAVLERKGARCGLITTRGFRDILELGRRTRPHAYGLTGSFEALIPRELRLEVTERIDADGNVLTPLDGEEVRQAVVRLQALGAEALVIHFLHAYANPEHELQAERIAREIWHNEYITVGSRIMTEFREFERGSTAALNGLLQPIITPYISRLNRRLKSDGLPADLLVMQGNGGMMAASSVRDFAVHTIMSGPAAGTIAAAATAEQAGFDQVISCDMGGTSFDVALIRGGIPEISHEKELSYGVPARVPMIDVQTIGSGGGSIARVDQAGILRVGPESAGAIPGPIGYNRGGERVTVTDANLALGRIDLDAIPGLGTGDDLSQVNLAMVDQIGRPLGLSVEEAALAVLAVSNNQLAGAIRLVSIERGLDPRGFALFAFGGAGPLHISALARELDITTVIVPRFPGITSALGCVLADVRHDFVQTLNRPLFEVNRDDIDQVLAEQVKWGRQLIAEEGAQVSRTDVAHEADLLYHGQSHVLRIGIASPGFDLERVLSSFTDRYLDRFDIALPEMTPVLVNLRTTVTGRRAGIDLKLFAPSETGAAAPVDIRPVCFGDQWVETEIYHRDELGIGGRIDGPAIIEQPDATTLLEPGDCAEVDAFGNLIISIAGEGAAR